MNLKEYLMQGWKKNLCFYKKKFRFLGFLGFNLQMPDTKL